MHSEVSHRRLAFARGLRVAGEVVVAFLGCGIVWGFAGNDAVWEWIAAGAIALLCSIHFAYCIVSNEYRFQVDGLMLGLAGLILLSVVQLVPLPESLVHLVSPGAFRLHQEMRPEYGELLPGETVAVPRPTHLPLTLNPYQTRLFALRMFALLLVAFTLRNGLATPEAFQRFAWVGSVNGLAVAVLAVGQFFSSPSNTIYWTFATEGAVFGPFVCRNHAVDYLAVCAGLAIGIALRRLPRVHVRKVADIPGEVARDPQLLVAILCTVGIFVAVAFSLSRGGMLAILVASTITVVVYRPRKLGLGLVLLGTGVLCFFAFGGNKILPHWQARIAGTERENRLELWQNGLAAVPEFWLVGSGNGTFRWVEPLARKTEDASLYAEHAHNEYLEALVEGGPVRLALLLLLVGVVLKRAVRFHRGLFFGFLVVVGHSAVDFAIQMPAVALLVVIAVSFAKPEVASSQPSVNRGLAMIFAVGMLCVALLLCGTAYSRESADWHRRRASEFGPENRQLQIHHLQVRITILPSDPQAHLDLALAHLDAARALAPLASGAIAGTPGTSILGPARYPADVVNAHIVPALRALRTARDLLPASPEVQAELARFAYFFAVADSPSRYAERGLRLLPSDAELHIVAGTEAWRIGDAEQAMQHWRQALVIAPSKVPAVLNAIGGKLSPAMIRQRILPDDPLVLWEATNRFYPNRVAQREERQRFVAVVAAALSREALSRNQLLAVADACTELEQMDDAEQAYERALRIAPNDEYVRERFAAWLEADERYALAVVQWEWLLNRHPANRNFQDRLKVAQHGAKLAEELRR